MSNASLELGGGNWAAKDNGDGTGSLLGYAVGDTSGKYLPREFTFSRGADIAATRVNKDGLIEKYRENLIKSSNDFTATGWTPAQATLLSGYDGYDGTNDAWFLRADSSTFSRVGMDNTTSTGLSSTGLRTFSVYAKKKDYDYVGIYIQGSNKGVVFSLLDGTAVNSIISYPDIYSDGIEVGGGWWRFSISHTTTTSTTAAAIYACEAAAYDGNSNYGKGIYIQDAQFEYGLVATDYLESDDETGKAGVLDNLPRIDYTSGSAQLLMEPSRTNYVPYSEYFETWDKTGTITITSNYGISPDGLKNSSRIQFGGASNELRDETSVSAGNVSTIYIKGTSGETIKFGSNGSEALFTLNGEWQRIEQYNAIASTKITLNTYSGATARDVEVWGAMQEVGSYATSYIPNYGTALGVTRNADSCFLQSAVVHSSGTGTIFFEIGDYDTNTSASGFNKILVFNEVSTSSIDNVIYFEEYAGDNTILIRKGGSNLLQTTPSYQNLRGSKIAIKWSSEEAKVFIDGVLNKTYTGDASLDIQYFGFNAQYNGGIVSTIKMKQLAGFSTALTDPECIALTTA